MKSKLWQKSLFIPMSILISISKYMAKSMANLSINLLEYLGLLIMSAMFYLVKFWKKATTRSSTPLPSSSAEASKSRFIPGRY